MGCTDGGPEREPESEADDPDWIDYAIAELQDASRQSRADWAQVHVTKALAAALLGILEEMRADR